ncbi:fibroblast growth factor receptor 2-like [Glandiceps talaboti]
MKSGYLYTLASTPFEFRNSSRDVQCNYTRPVESNAENTQIRNLYLPEGPKKRNKAALIGEDITFTCPVESNGILKYRWMKKPSGTSNYTDRISRVGNHDPIQVERNLTLQSIVRSDGGYYKCIAEDGPCSLEFMFTLFISNHGTMPVFDKRYPEDKIVTVGSNVTFMCVIQVNNGPLQNTYWLKHKYSNEEQANANMKAFQNSRAADSNTSINAFVNGLFNDMVMELVFQGGTTMTLQNVDFSDAGIYTCYSSNDLGSDYSSATLTVTSVNVTESDVGFLTTIIIVVPTLTLLIVCLVVVFVSKRCRRSRNRELRIAQGKHLTFHRLASSVSGPYTNCDILNTAGVNRITTKNSYVESTHCAKPDIMKESVDPAWEFARNKLKLGDGLGEGAFGKVLKADACGILKEQAETTVAVKMLKANATDADMRALNIEMDYMKTVGKHVNVISFLGCCTVGGPLLLIFEYAAHGNMRDFLRARRHTGIYQNLQPEGTQPLTNKNLISFAYQIARGMEFLASGKCVHRDLAARNVLVDETFTMKIADFGLARDLRYEDYYKKNSQGRVPIKWMSPEALFDRVYTTKSDVWSFGIVLWEIMTLGGTPYPSVPLETMFEYLKSGKRMACPKGCPLEIYGLMRRCWITVPGHRPDFPKLVNDLDVLLSQSTNEEYLALEFSMTDIISDGEDSSTDNGGSKVSTV